MESFDEMTKKKRAFRKKRRKEVALLHRQHERALREQMPEGLSLVKFTSRGTDRLVVVRRQFDGGEVALTTPIFRFPQPELLVQLALIT